MSDNTTTDTIDAKIAASEKRIERLERDAETAEPGDDYDYAINQERQYLQGLYSGRERSAHKSGWSHSTAYKCLTCECTFDVSDNDAPSDGDSACPRCGSSNYLILGRLYDNQPRIDA